MKVIKFLGRILSSPLRLSIAVGNVLLLPIKILSHLLKGEIEYLKQYWAFTKNVMFSLKSAIKRGDKPVLHTYLVYTDDLNSIVLLNDAKTPLTIKINKDGKTE